jgi:hypothetical protein
MSSNEHPDMSGNPCDAPFVCEMCDREVREDNIWGTRYDEEVILCSQECAKDFDEREESKHQ